jgi:hypothetical protein
MPLTLLVCALMGGTLLRQRLMETQAQLPAWDKPPSAAVSRQLKAAPADAVSGRSLASVSNAASPPRQVAMPDASAVASASMTLVDGLPLDEADNVRWSLIRRTPAAAQVFDGRNVDWEALRTIEASGTILVPHGFTWSFNETFQRGPGYKQASGILAGGHCALATVFNGAAKAAGLPTSYKQHRTPYPGYALSECVNIYWGRDDLRIQNVAAADFRFRWALTSDALTVEVLPGPHPGEAALPPIHGATIAMVYGRPESGTWGSLGETDLVDQAMHRAFRYSERVDQWNGSKPVVTAVNPNILMAGASPMEESYIYHLIGEAKRQGAYVMLDVQTGSREPYAVFTELMDKYLSDNVWFDWDLEHTTGGRVHSSQINRVAAEYFRRRAERGYTSPGLFAFYIFDMAAVQAPSQLETEYANGAVLPIFDGYGPRQIKINETHDFVRHFGVPYGIMEFDTKWGQKYDDIPARDYLGAFPDTWLFASQ